MKTHFDAPPIQAHTFPAEQPLPKAPFEVQEDQLVCVTGGMLTIGLMLHAPPAGEIGDPW
jgi:hypothetical protein